MPLISCYLNHDENPATFLREVINVSSGLFRWGDVSFMAHLWHRSSSGLVAKALAAKEIWLTAEEGPAGSPHRHQHNMGRAALLMRVEAGAGPQWALIAPHDCHVLVNGRPPIAGLSVLRDRDEDPFRIRRSLLLLDGEPSRGGGVSRDGAPRVLRPGTANDLSLGQARYAARRAASGFIRDQTFPVGLIRKNVRFAAGRLRSKRACLLDPGGLMDAPVRHLATAGLGVTGSHLAPHLARMPEIERVTLVDPDAYSPENRTQNIEKQSDLGKAKVEAVAERMLRIRPNLEVSPVAARIEDVPRGQLACEAFVSCLDTKIARQHLNSIAWQMGTTWLDCGVLGSQSLVRVSGYRPGDESACLECSWNAGPNGEYLRCSNRSIFARQPATGFPAWLRRPGRSWRPRCWPSRSRSCCAARWPIPSWDSRQYTTRNTTVST